MHTPRVEENAVVVSSELVRGAAVNDPAVDTYIADLKFRLDLVKKAIKALTKLEELRRGGTRK